MATPYTSGPHILQVTGGQEICLELRCPSRGTIRTLKFDQVAGDPANCDFEVYTKREVCPPGQSSESLSEAVQGPQSAYSVFGEKNFTAGTPLIEANVNYAYQNNDAGPTNRARKLYIRMNPAGSGAKEYAITFEVEVSPLG